MRIFYHITVLWYRITGPFVGFWRYLCALFSYAKFLRKNHHNWDYNFLLELLRFKLERMEKLFRSERCHIEGGEKVADEMREAISLIDEIGENDFIKEEYEYHDNKWGKLDIRCGERVGSSVKAIFHRDNVITEEDKEQENLELQVITLLEEQQIQDAYNKLFSQMAKRIRTWWD